MKKNILYIFCFLALWACKNRPMQPSDYIDYIQKETSINKEIAKGDFIFKCSYRPAAYMALTDMRNEIENINAKSIFKDRLKQMENGFYLSISISNVNEIPIMLSSPEYKNYIPMYLQSEEALNDLEVVLKEGSTLKPLQLIFNNQGNTPTLTMLIVFANKQIDNGAFSVGYSNKFFGVQEKIVWGFSINPKAFEREIIF